MASVADLGERETIRRILARLGPAASERLGPGDDCAVLDTDGDTVVTTDMMVEGPDFRLDWQHGFELGWKLAATNLSDVAAMGARPRALTVAIACPGETPVNLLEEIAHGLDAGCRELAPGCGVVGGDLSLAPVVTAAVTALGDLGGREAVTRSGAAPGDIVAYAGQLGLAGRGLRILFEHADHRPSAVSTLRAEYPIELAAQFTPRPPIALGGQAARAGATAMLDVSDGLSLDATRVAHASSVVIELSSAQLSEAFGTQSGVAVSIAEMLSGGEDHGLLATFPALVQLPAGFHAIGRVRDAVPADPPSLGPLLLDGQPCAAAGWDPFAAR